MRGWKFHFPICSIIFPYKQKKIPTKKWYFDHNSGGGVGHFVVATTQKYHFFFTPPLISHDGKGYVIELDYKLRNWEYTFERLQEMF